MNSSAGDHLRALVNDYYHGLVTFDSYRERRGRLLDSLQAKTQPDPADTARLIRPTMPAPETAPAATAAVAPAAKPAHVSAPQAQQQRRAPVPLKRLAAGGVLLVVAVVLLYGPWRSEPDDAALAPAAEESAAIQALPAGAALLEQFTQRNIWDPDSVRNLEVAWDGALSEEQRQTALASASYGRFAEALRRRLREEEALGDAGNSAELENLIRLATRLNMPYAAARETPPQRPSSAGAAPSSAVPEPAPAPAPEAAATPALAADRIEAAPAVPAAAPPARGADPVAREVTAQTPLAAPAPPSAGNSAAAPAAGPATDAAADTGPPCSAALLSTRRPFCIDGLSAGGQGPALAILPAGEFVMGSDGADEEGPPHSVTIPAPLAMAVYEISSGDFARYCSAAGLRCPQSPWSGADVPVVQISWAEAVAYADWLSVQTGQRYRLPTEAEWEYAARAGTQTPYPFGSDVTPAAARSSANGAVDSPIANSDRSVNRNAFRLFHMIGNVREWVADPWHADHAGAPSDGSARPGESSSRVVRGGAYSDVAAQLRSSARVGLESSSADALTGFRVVREITQ